jgi:hypothetical protein
MPRQRARIRLVKFSTRQMKCGYRKIYNEFYFQLSKLNKKSQNIGKESKSGKGVGKDEIKRLR